MPEKRVKPELMNKVASTRVVHVHDSVHMQEVSEVTAILNTLNNDAALIMQTFVEKGEKTDDGEIIITVTEVWYEYLMELDKNPALLYKTGWRKMEEIIAGMHKRIGIFDEVILTKRTRGDYGRDVILVKHGHYALHFFDQIKAYAPGNLVTADMLKASIATMDGFGYQKAIITTTSDFAPEILKDPTIKRLYPNRLELRNGETLREMLLELKNKK